MPPKRPALESAPAPPVKKIHPMFAPVSARAAMPVSLFNWHAALGAKGTCLHGTYSTQIAAPTGSAKIAAFDLDGTLIATRSGNTFPRSKDDWRLWRGNVKAKLQQAHADGFAIVLLTNQGTLSEELAHTNPAGYKGSKAQWFKDKVADIGAALDVPFHIFAATDMKDAFRKPQTGMWDAYVRDFNDGVVVNMKESFFVGDAAGRPALRNRPKDHSNSDLKMAENAALPFLTPEEYFVR